MRWAWDRSGTIGMFVVFGLILLRTAQQTGLWSQSFFWTVIYAVQLRRSL
jgi:hypothetical protein